ncbi:MAG: oligosaccharide flippase family protein [Candidatus Omnitrophica bacterium]|nr:oligosaccharide flippase family protein [Candidatus Omnitrophota bacterium]
MHPLIKDSVILFFSNGFRQVIMLITGVIVPRTLGPAVMGMLNMVKLVFEWAPYAECGMSNSLSRDIPVLRGKGDDASIAAVKDTFFTFTVVTGSIFIAVVLVFMIMIKDSAIAPGIRYAVIAIAPFAIFVNLATFLSGMMRAENDFRSMAAMQYIWSVVFALVTFLTLRAWGMYAVLGALCVAYSVTVIVIFLQKKYRLKWRILPSVLVPAFAVGLPTMVGALFPTLRDTIERMLIVAFRDWKALGLYTLGTDIAFYLLVSLPAVFVQPLAPRIYEQYGRERSGLLKYMIAPTYAVALTAAIPAAFGYITAPFFFNILFPNFTAGVPTAQVLLLGRSFMALGFIPCFIFIAFNRAYLIVLIQAAVLIFLTAMQYLALKTGHGIYAVAVVSGVGLCVYGMAMTFLAYRVCNASFGRMSGFAVRLVLLYGYTLGACLLTNYLAGFGDPQSFAVAARKMVVLTVLLCPLMWRMFVYFRKRVFTVGT